MGSSPVTVERFGGLNTRDDPLEIGSVGATAMSNVDLDHRGRLRTRDGYVRIANTTTSVGGPMIYYQEPGLAGAPADEYIVAVTGASSTKPLYLGSSGTNGDTLADAPLSNNSMIRFGAPGEMRLYLTAAGVISRLDGPTWTAVSSPSIALYSSLSILPRDNRLVVTEQDSGTVWFSQPNDPETFDSSDSVTLGPGDGEQILAAVAWRDNLFVFKRTKFFVFYGTSTDADGGAIFNYRTVESGIGVNGLGMVAAGAEGVYFVGVDGVYLTTGDTPTLVSGSIDPFPYPTDCVLGYHDHRLYVLSLTADKLLVFNSGQDLWVSWDIDAAGMCVVPSNTFGSQGVYIVDGSSGRIGKLGGDTDDGTTATNGTAVPWSYTSGRYQLADPGTVAITRESSVVGSGTVQLDITTDLYGEVTGTPTVLGTAPATAEGWPVGDQEGTWFQHTLSGTGPASVNRLTHYVSSVKAAGIR